MFIRSISSALVVAPILRCAVYEFPGSDLTESSLGSEVDGHADPKVSYSHNQPFTSSFQRPARKHHRTRRELDELRRRGRVVGFSDTDSVLTVSSAGETGYTSFQLPSTFLRPTNPIPARPVGQTIIPVSILRRPLREPEVLPTISQPFHVSSVPVRPPAPIVRPNSTPNRPLLFRADVAGLVGTVRLGEGGAEVRMIIDTIGRDTFVNPTTAAIEITNLIKVASVPTIVSFEGRTLRMQDKFSLDYGMGGRSELFAYTSSEPLIADLPEVHGVVGLGRGSHAARNSFSFIPTRDGVVVEYGPRSIAQRQCRSDRMHAMFLDRDASMRGKYVIEGSRIRMGTERTTIVSFLLSTATPGIELPPPMFKRFKDGLVANKFQVKRVQVMGNEFLSVPDRCESILPYIPKFAFYTSRKQSKIELDARDITTDSNSGCIIWVRPAASELLVKIGAVHLRKLVVFIDNLENEMYTCTAKTA
jgi:hypothetical protein